MNRKEMQTMKNTEEKGVRPLFLAKHKRGQTPFFAAGLAAIGLILLAVAPAPAADANAPAVITTATSPTTTTSAPAEAVSEEVMNILRELEAAGDKYRTIRSDLDYEVVNLTLGDSEKRTGWVAYSKGDDKTPTRFRVTFEKCRLGAGAEFQDQVDYAFDGQWLTVAKHKIKNITLYQLAAEGQKVEPLRIGKGPFPLPFGQKAADMVKYFIPTTRAPVESDPNGTIYLRLVTRPQYVEELPATRMEMWIDAKTYLPVRLKSRDKNKAVTTVTFKDIRTNKAVDENFFRIPHPIGYEVIRRPLDRQGAVAP
jgi:hypothetical protein